MSKGRTAAATALLAAAALLAAGFLLGGDRAAVDWAALRAVVLESDDWGLAGFIPEAGAWDGIDQAAISPGRFPEIYWGSTLEDSAQVADLAAVLASVRGRDGLPAVLQPNYVMGSLELRDGRWLEHRLPDLPAPYVRPGLWPAVAAARRAGVWHPEFHAAWHYDPQRRRERALDPGAPAAATRRGILLFPGSEGAWELGPWRPLDLLQQELAGALADFARVFGEPPASTIAPDYTWNGRVEDLSQRHGLRVLQAKREQRNPDLPAGRAGRLLKVLERRWAKLTHPGRIYLERNCRFEPVQFADPGAVTRSCRQEVFAAWARGEPAIVETHRVNFAHVDAAVARRGRAELAVLLEGIGAGQPIFLTDAEVAQLAVRGVSARTVPGQGVVLRNGSRSRRVVACRLPGSPVPVLAALPAGAAARLEEGAGGWRLVGLPGPAAAEPGI